MAERRRVERGDTAAIEECEREFIITAQSDSALLNSPELPPTAYADDIELMSDDELRAIVDRVRSIPRASSFELPRLQWGLQLPRQLRYNRVEGLSLGGRLVFDLGQATLGAEARLGLADRDPRGEIALERRGDLLHSRFAAYRRLASTTATETTHGALASLGALLFGRDDHDYFDALGGELVVRPPESHRQWYDVRLYAERQRAVERNTDLSVTHVIDSDHTFHENFTADAADQLGARVRFRTAFGLNPAAPRIAGELSLGGISLLDGVLRLDLAHGFSAPGGWRLHLHFNGVL